MDNSLKDRRKGVWGLVAILAAALLFVAATSLEQARVIDIQRGLIRQLSQDSLQLSAVRMQHQASRHSH
jgi:hypothetical protein